MGSFRLVPATNLTMLQNQHKEALVSYQNFIVIVTLIATIGQTQDE